MAQAVSLRGPRDAAGLQTVGRCWVRHVTRAVWRVAGRACGDVAGV